MPDQSFDRLKRLGYHRTAKVTTYREEEASAGQKGNGSLAESVSRGPTCKRSDQQGGGGGVGRRGGGGRRKGGWVGGGNRFIAKKTGPQKSEVLF